MDIYNELRYAQGLTEEEITELLKEWGLLEDKEKTYCSF